MSRPGDHWASGRGADEVPRSAATPNGRIAEARARRDAAFARLAEVEQRLAETKRRSARWELVESISGLFAAFSGLAWALLKLLGLLIVLRLLWHF